MLTGFNYDAILILISSRFSPYNTLFWLTRFQSYAQFLVCFNRFTDIQRKAKTLGPVWNEGIQNTGIGKNAGIWYDEKQKTMGFQNIGIENLGCLEHGNS